MDIRITPHTLNGIVEATSSKSYLERALIISSLCSGITNINFNESSQDVGVFEDAILSFGATVKKTATGMQVCGNGCANIGLSKESVVSKEESLKKEQRCVENNIKNTQWCDASINVDLKKCGTAMRMFLPYTLYFNKKVVFSLDNQLSNRPIEDFVALLNSFGGKIEKKENKIFVQGSIKSGEYIVDTKKTTQYLSALMIILPLLDGDSKLIFEKEPLPYCDITKDVMRMFGVSIEEKEYGYYIKGNQKYVATNIDVEGDFSNSAPFIVGSAIGNIVRVTGLNKESLQGDAKIYQLMSAIVSKGSTLNMSTCIDIVPIMAVLSAYACGKTTFTGVSKLIYKESNRLLAIKENINILGGKAEIEDNNLVVYGTCGLKGGTVSGFNDHRIVMAMAIAGTVSNEPIIIKGAEAVEKSYPTFFDKFRSLGGIADVV